MMNPGGQVVTWKGGLGSLVLALSVVHGRVMGDVMFHRYAVYICQVGSEGHSADGQMAAGASGRWFLRAR